MGVQGNLLGNLEVLGMLFVGILLAVGVIVFGYVADLTGDDWHPYEQVIAAGCSDDNASTEGVLCSGTVANPSIEDGTRAEPVVQNCSSGGVCQTMTNGTHYNYTADSGTFTILTSALGDIYNGSIRVSYWEDEWRDTVDNAQQSISSTTYSGFELGTVMIIVAAAGAIIGGIFLVGRRGE